MQNRKRFVHLFQNQPKQVYNMENSKKVTKSTKEMFDLLERILKIKQIMEECTKQKNEKVVFDISFELCQAELALELLNRTDIYYSKIAN